MDHDVIILGSSFSGSLLGWILAARGMRVLVIDRGRHPRFAIGESSTPAADLILADLARRHRLPELAPLARWGSWQAAYPHLGCGKKRGFSYFHHRPGEPFRDTLHHASSLLVAASATDAGSDTHWLRADVDLFLFASAVEIVRADLINSSTSPHANSTVRIPILHVKPWLIALNQARLTLAARFSIGEEHANHPAPEDLSPTTIAQLFHADWAAPREYKVHNRY